MAAITLDGLIADVVQQMGLYGSGTASAGSTTTLVDATGRIEPDNVWVNHYIRFLSGDNLGQERLVTAYAQASAQLTFGPAVADAVGSGDTYRVSPLRHEDAERAIQRAIRRAGDDWLIVKSDETGSFMTGVQEYEMPADCLTVLRCWIWCSIDPLVGEWVPFTEYELLGGPGERKMLLRRWNVGEPVGYAYARKIEYVAVPTAMSSTAGLGFDEAGERQIVSFIEEYALHLLHEQALARAVTGEQARVHLQMARDHQAKALQIKAERTPLRVTRRMTTMNIGRQK